MLIIGKIIDKRIMLRMIKDHFNGKKIFVYVDKISECVNRGSIFELPLDNMNLVISTCIERKTHKQVIPIKNIDLTYINGSIDLETIHNKDKSVVIDNIYTNHIYYIQDYESKDCMETNSYYDHFLNKLEKGDNIIIVNHLSTQVIYGKILKIDENGILSLYNNNNRIVRYNFDYLSSKCIFFKVNVLDDYINNRLEKILYDRTII